MLTSSQIRAARHAVGWSADQLAQKCALSRRTIVSIEKAEGVPPVNTTTLVKIQTALEAAGIEFIGGPGDAPGIRIHAARDATARASER